MCIMQVSSTGVVLILEEQVKYLISDVVGIGSDFFFFCREIYNSISLILNHSECFVSLVSTQSFIVGTTSLECVFQTSFSPEVL